MRIDAHHHFWQLSKYTYPWMSGGDVLAPIRHDYGPNDLRPLLPKHRIDGTVLVQTISSVDETRWFMRLGRDNPYIKGVVGWCDLADPNIGKTLEEFLAAPGRLVGVRHQIEEETDPNWLLRPEVRRGLRTLAQHKLTYDLLIKPVHLRAALTVAHELSELPFVIDHIAKPCIAEKNWNGWGHWAAGMRELAACPNVYCKLSGMITEANWKEWQASDLQPYIQHALDIFSPQRLMFGSDWPVCLLAGDYDRTVEALEANLDALSPAEKSDIFGNAAVRFYRLT